MYQTLNLATESRFSNVTVSVCIYACYKEHNCTHTERMKWIYIKAWANQYEHTFCVALCIIHSWHDKGKNEKWIETIWWTAFVLGITRRNVERLTRFIEFNWQQHDQPARLTALIDANLLRVPLIINKFIYFYLQKVTKFPKLKIQDSKSNVFWIGKSLLKDGKN